MLQSFENMRRILISLFVFNIFLVGYWIPLHSYEKYLFKNLII